MALRSQHATSLLLLFFVVLAGAGEGGEVGATVSWPAGRGGDAQVAEAKVAPAESRSAPFPQPHHKLRESSPLFGAVTEFEVVEVTHTASSPSPKDRDRERSGPQTSRLPWRRPNHVDFPQDAQFSFRAFGSEHQLDLVRTAHVVASDYREVYQSESGRVLRELTAADRPNCYYRGRDNGAVRASFALCEGLSGAFWTPETGVLHVEPAHRHLQPEDPGSAAAWVPGEEGAPAATTTTHVVFRYPAPPSGASCGFEDGDGPFGFRGEGAGAEPLPGVATGGSSKQPPAGSRNPRPQATLNVQMLLMSDFQRYSRLRGLTASSALALINHANNAFLDAATRVGFSDTVVLSVKLQTVWTVADPYDAPAAPCPGCDSSAKMASAMLDLVAGSVLPNATLTVLPVSSFDNSYLLTGYNLASNQSDAVVGLARLGTMCSASREQSVGMVESTAALSELFQGITLAHELGHNFGLLHDQSYSSCATDQTHIMSAFATPTSPPSQFSSCSAVNFNTLIASSSERGCLLDGPAPSVVAPACGNGLVEDGEDCDCGYNGCAGVDRCCDDATCRYSSGSPCGERDACCVYVGNATCALRSAGEQHVCRPAASTTCDMPETCDGTRPSCPVDLFAGGGVACIEDGAAGACFLGECVTGKKSCMAANSTFVDCPFDLQNALSQQLGEGYCTSMWCREPSTPEDTCFSFLFEPDGTVCHLDATFQCLSGTCKPAADVAAAALARAGINATWELVSDYNESDCVCGVETRTFRCLVEGTAVSDQRVCYPSPVLERTCDRPPSNASADVVCPGQCTSSEWRVWVIGCQSKTNMKLLIAGMSLSVLCCACYLCVREGSVVRRVKRRDGRSIFDFSRGQQVAPVPLSPFKIVSRSIQPGHGGPGSAAGDRRSSAVSMQMVGYNSWTSRANNSPKSSPRQSEAIRGLPKSNSATAHVHVHAHSPSSPPSSSRSPGRDRGSVIVTSYE